MIPLSNENECADSANPAATIAQQGRQSPKHNQMMHIDNKAISVADIPNASIAMPVSQAPAATALPKIESTVVEMFIGGSNPKNVQM